MTQHSKDTTCYSHLSQVTVGRLLLSAEDAARVLGIGRRHFYSLHSSGRLGPQPVKLGKRSLWIRQELERWAAARCPTREQWLHLQGDKA
jgi:predicted DNA-binding transcriptional regulator AlpA